MKQRNHLEIFSDSGGHYDAAWNLSWDEDAFVIAVEAYGGTTKTNPTHRDRAEALECLLQRIAALGGILEGAEVDTLRTRARGLTRVERTLNLSSAYPLNLSERDEFRSLRLELDAATRVTASESKKSGAGTPGRRIVLRMGVPGYASTDLLQLRALISTGRPIPADSTEPSLREGIARLRPEQIKFRDDLLLAYRRKCAVTDCEVVDALEAAHLVPYCRSGLTDVRNGLLLRADVHRLLDAGLIAFVASSQGWKVVVEPTLRSDVAYGRLHECPLSPARSDAESPRLASMLWRAPSF